jgi:hypothetical protein
LLFLRTWRVTLLKRLVSWKEWNLDFAAKDLDLVPAGLDFDPPSRGPTEGLASLELQSCRVAEKGA